MKLTSLSYSKHISAGGITNALFPICNTITKVCSVTSSRIIPCTLKSFLNISMQKSRNCCRIEGGVGWVGGALNPILIAILTIYKWGSMGPSDLHLGSYSTVIIA